MIALIGNVNWMELMLIAVIAVIVFGRDLPRVAAKAFIQLQKLRRGVQQVWRETGISQEMRNLSRELEEGERALNAPLEKARRAQAELRAQIEHPVSASEPEDAAAEEARVIEAAPVPGEQAPREATGDGSAEDSGTGQDAEDTEGEPAEYEERERR